jgi:sulfur relay (sulfurtransferase) DsrC/TusE family protein
MNPENQAEETEVSENIENKNPHFVSKGIRRTNDDNAFYHAQRDYVSSSCLKSVAKRSVYHYLNTNFSTSSDALTIGSAFHTLVLEPHLFDEEFHVAQKIDRRTKAGKAKAAALEAELIAQGKMSITEENWAMIKNMRDNILADKVCSEILTGGEPEVSFYVEDFHGIKVRVRPDYLGEDYIVDLKSCQDAAPDMFSRDIYKYNWKLQAAFYADVLGMDKFYFLASEKKSPYHCQLYLMSQKSLDYGRKMYLKAIEDWKRYLDSGIAPGYNHPSLKNGVITL